MPPSLTSTYIIPAILFNPAILLHGLNTFMFHQRTTHTSPSALPPSPSLYPWLERLGPVGSSKPYFDVHENDHWCWWYTLVMVMVQIAAYGKVSSARGKRKSAKAAREGRKEDGDAGGGGDDYWDEGGEVATSAVRRKSMDGLVTESVLNGDYEGSDAEEGSIPETSSEEEIMH